MKIQHYLLWSLFIFAVGCPPPSQEGTEEILIGIDTDACTIDYDANMYTDPSEYKDCHQIPIIHPDCRPLDQSVLDKQPPDKKIAIAPCNSQQDISSCGANSCVRECCQAHKRSDSASSATCPQYLCRWMCGCNDLLRFVIPPNSDGKVGAFAEICPFYPVTTWGPESCMKLCGELGSSLKQFCRRETQNDTTEQCGIRQLICNDRDLSDVQDVCIHMCNVYQPPRELMAPSALYYPGPLQIFEQDDLSCLFPNQAPTDWKGTSADSLRRAAHNTVCAPIFNANDLDGSAANCNAFPLCQHPTDSVLDALPECGCLDFSQVCDQQHCVNKCLARASCPAGYPKCYEQTTQSYLTSRCHKSSNDQITDLNQGDLWKPTECFTKDKIRWWGCPDSYDSSTRDELQCVRGAAGRPAESIVATCYSCFPLEFTGHLCERGDNPLNCQVKDAAGKTIEMGSLGLDGQGFCTWNTAVAKPDTKPVAGCDLAFGNDAPALRSIIEFCATSKTETDCSISFGDSARRRDYCEWKDNKCVLCNKNSLLTCNLEEDYLHKCTDKAECYWNQTANACVAKSVAGVRPDCSKINLPPGSARKCIQLDKEQCGFAFGEDATVPICQWNERYQICQQSSKRLQAACKSIAGCEWDTTLGSCLTPEDATQFKENLADYRNVGSGWWCPLDLTKSPTKLFSCPANTCRLEAKNALSCGRCGPNTDKGKRLIRDDDGLCHP